MRSQWACTARVPASKAHGLAPRRRRRPRSRACASGRGRGGRGATARARSVTLQHQVPVLGALELGVEAADLLDQRAAQDAEVAGVHLRAHPLRRPVGLEEGAASGGRRGRSCPRRCRRSRPRGLPSMAAATWSERVGMELVVVVEQGDELAAGHRQGVVGGGDDAAVLVAALDPDPRVGAPPPARASRARAAAGAVVDQAQLPVGEALALGPSRASLEHAGRRVVDRREDREARHGHGAWA